MFEKSLYDLIRGIRNHKGNEKEYIQNCLKECRKEVRGADMDLKATGLLKLVYLEMFGHDMSWASFHVLEVMSSPKFNQKRVGYLGAVQSFRADTEVLMLATNLLKKDLSSPSTPVLSLPIAALPHLINPSLALSVLSDMLPRLSHSNPAIRKKTIVTLYRLALVYPETLRAAWPKIKERLMDRDEDPSVTSAIVNVICELGWRRPRDFLPLAPRLFELLVGGGNNWMAIKLIKLFATLTPLEPRLVRKLLPPLTELIRTTPAMSLLYECINGIIQGGILGSADDVSGREEIATLCVNKLRSMILVDGDPNLKYVALLAFNRIVVTHPFLVSQQEDVILGCIDSPDVTIRIKVLDLVQGMVNSDNLVLIVSQLMKQLKEATSAQETAPTEPYQFDDDEKRGPKSSHDTTLLPEEYRFDVMGRILKMCSQDNYANISDFDWYIDVLVSLVHMAPAPRGGNDEASTDTPRASAVDVSGRIGDELRNVAVKVKALRGAVVHAGARLIDRINTVTPSGHSISSNAVKSVVWMLGEYASQLASPQDTLTSLLLTVTRTSSPEILALCLQAIPKIFAVCAQDGAEAPWTAERKSVISLTMARMLHTIEPLTRNPNLAVQDRAVEFHELLKLTSEAVASQPVSTAEEAQGAPLLLVQAIPSLFAGWELNSVAPGAQRSVPLPVDLDLDEPIHSNLAHLLSQADSISLEPDEPDDFDAYYTQKPAPTSISSGPAIDRLAGPQEEVVSSYQQADEDSYMDAEVLARRRAERLERNRDDPFYIPPSDDLARASTPIHNILQSANGPDLDIDNIPIMKLDLENISAAQPGAAFSLSPARAAPKPRQKVVIAADETLSASGSATPSRTPVAADSEPSDRARGSRTKQSSLLRIPGANLAALSLEPGPPGSAPDRVASASYAEEEAEMARAMKEVERLRLEMQRANERIQVAQGVVPEVVRSKRRKTKAGAEGDDGEEKKKKKGKRKMAEEEPATASGGGEHGSGSADDADDAAVVVVSGTKKKKKKKKTKVAEIHDPDQDRGRNEDLIET